ncbi:MAG: outer membrane lipoprotein-sorting protein [Microscillaceae bacterium]|jgi:outer membrane lipoprotein-sorting protein|nr:outer membrane lipoprotein-sorting protein [Microscillaceae bacterium]
MKTIKNLLAICLIALLSATYAQAQTADEIINKYIDAIGGKAKWKALKSMTQTGKAPSPQGDIPFLVQAKAPNKLKVTATFQGKEMVFQCFDGKEFWGVNFMNMQAEKKSAEETKEMQDEAEFESKLLDYASKGHKISLEGKETIDGTECFKIKMVEKDGDNAYYFFDTDNYVLIMTRTYGKSGQMKGMEIESYLSDYKEVEGMMMPHSTEQKIKGQTISKILADTIKINEAIDDKIFAFPAPAGK